MKKNNKKGFTLVELVIVVAVMAILVAVAIPTIGNVTNRAKDSVAKSNAQTIESMVKLAEADAKVDDADATLSAAKIADVIVQAKLGINDGTFYYTVATGKVDTTGTVSATAGSVVYSIEFTDTAVTVTNGTETATKNLDGSTTSEG